MILVNSPLSSLTPNERKENAAWKKNTKYRSRVSFWKNNHYVRVKITEDNQYIIHSMKKSHNTGGFKWGYLIDLRRHQRKVY